MMIMGDDDGNSDGFYDNDNDDDSMDETNNYDRPNRFLNQTAHHK